MTVARFPDRVTAGPDCQGWIYDCRDDDPEEEAARPHCDLARHRRMEARRKRRA